MALENPRRAIEAAMSTRRSLGGRIPDASVMSSPATGY